MRFSRPCRKVSRAPTGWGLDDTEENDHTVKIDDHVDLCQFGEAMAGIDALDEDDHEDE